MTATMKPFQYHQPQSIAQACTLLADLGESARVMAGGTDLLVRMKKGQMSPAHVVNLKQVAELDGIRETDTGVVLGALTRLSDLVEHRGLDARIPVLGRAAATIGSSQIRNRATLGGNLCNASPSADMSPSLMVLEATVTIAGPRGRREISLEEFFCGPGQVDLAAGELLAGVTVPWPAAGRRTVYLKHGPRKAMDCALVGVAASLEVEDGTGCCRNPRIALGAVAPTPVRLRDVERLLEGRCRAEISQPDVEQAVRDGIRPISDVRASAAYRNDVSAVLTMRAIDALMNGKEGAL